MDKILKGSMIIFISLFGFMAYQAEDSVGEIEDGFAGGTVSGDINLNGNNLTDSSDSIVDLDVDLRLTSGERIYGTTTPLILGKTGTPNKVTDADAVYIGEDLEVDGAANFDGTTSLNAAITFGGNSTHSNNVRLQFGSSSTSGLLFSTAQTPDSLFFGVEPTSNRLIIGNFSQRAVDHAFAQADEPTITITSTKGAGLHITNQTESLTFAGNPGDATKTTTGTAIPDGALLLGVSTRVTTAGTNCSAYYVGSAGDPDHFADDATTGVAQGTDTDNTDATTNYYTSYYPTTANTEIVITGTDGADGATNCFDMVVEVTTSYIDISAATQN